MTVLNTSSSFHPYYQQVGATYSQGMPNSIFNLTFEDLLLVEDYIEDLMMQHYMEFDEDH